MYIIQISPSFTYTETEKKDEHLTFLLSNDFISKINCPTGKCFPVALGEVFITEGGFISKTDSMRYSNFNYFTELTL